MNEIKMKFIEPYVHCPRCDSQGFIVSEGRAIRCGCWVEYRNRLSLIKKFLEANLIVAESSKEEVDRLMSYSLDDYKGKDRNSNIPKVRKFIRHFDERFNSINLFFTGANGTQKTTVAKNIVVELLRSNHTAYYIITKDLIDIIMSAERDEEKAVLLDRILKVDLLVLEEFSTDKMALYASNYKQSIFTSPIKKRFENIRKSTIIISNSSMEELKEGQLGSTIGNLIDRETKDCQFVFTDRYGDYATVDLSSIWD